MLDVVWHPHQKLWNSRLQAAVRRAGTPLGLGDRLVATVIAVDSGLLLLRVAARRAHEFGPRQAFRPLSSTTRTVLYIDCGLHKRGEQVRVMRTWFGDRCDLRVIGFEASADHALHARAALADLPGVEIRQCALVGPANERRFVKLFRGSGSGKADSLYASTVTATVDVELVPAERLSTLLRRDFGDLVGHAPVLVRMNIEGSEYDVVEDLVAAGIAPEVDGWFGMWDDVGKRDKVRDRAFRRMLGHARIRTVTFNDRDLGYPVRMLAIRLALDAAIRRGLERNPRSELGPRLQQRRA